eukprot:TRINITY_DN23927_c0_g1_i1.p1 TRINITY_DN23927_c0_g1~~TRINITY_DN23927_c0_g1_i1.p1  ORF type:complete len:139 (-),score=5.05 TRINITY_DN23927_c0_g1_i1:90-506(-)
MFRLLSERKDAIFQGFLHLVIANGTVVGRQVICILSDNGSLQAFECEEQKEEVQCRQILDITFENTHLEKAPGLRFTIRSQSKQQAFTFAAKTPELYQAWLRILRRYCYQSDFNDRYRVSTSVYEQTECQVKSIALDF